MTAQRERDWIAELRATRGREEFASLVREIARVAPELEAQVCGIAAEVDVEMENWTWEFFASRAAEAAFKNPAMQSEVESTLVAQPEVRRVAQPEGITIRKRPLAGLVLELKVEPAEPAQATREKPEGTSQLDALVLDASTKAAMFEELADTFENDDSVERSKYNKQKDEVAKVLDITPMDAHRAMKAVIDNRKKAKPVELTQSQKALMLVLGDRFRLWTDPNDQREYASFTANGHWENYQIGSSEFGRLVRAEYSARHSREFGDIRVPGIINDKALNEMILTAKAKAWTSGTEAAAVLRLGGGDGVVWFDLGRKDWTLVRVTAEGWRLWIEGVPNVAFIRRRGMLPLPMPVKGGDIQGLRRFLNVKKDEFVLQVGWLLGTFRPKGPHTIVAMSGSSDVGKTFACRVLLALTDPNLANLVSLGTPDNMYVAAYNRRVIAFDNVSEIDPEQADVLSKISTGVGYTKRALRTDADQFMMYACAPMMFNGIPDDLAERSDLATRVIAIDLPDFGEGDTEGGEEEFWREFEAAQPRLLGALLDGVVGAMRGADAISLAGRGRVRMADFARWAEAGCRTLGFAEGEFLTAFIANQKRAMQVVFRQDPVAQAIALLIEQCPPKGWKGNVRPLLAALKAALVLAERTDLLRQRGWPVNDVHLGRKLRRSAAVLRKLCGIAIAFDVDCRPKGDKDGIEIKRVAKRDGEERE